jgi:hypothetical protein
LTGARAGVASGCCGARGIPAGGVGPTAAIVCITPSAAAADGGDAAGAGAGAGAGAAGIGADGFTTGGADGVVTGPGAPSRCPQCWQNENPDGVCLPHDGHVTFPADAAASARAMGAAGSGAFAASEVPHILQKFIPAGLAVPHELHTAPPDGAAGFAAAGGGDGAGASSRCPQSWQNSEPSRLTFPHWVQRGIARVTSGVLLQTEIPVYGSPRVR